LTVDKLLQTSNGKLLHHPTMEKPMQRSFLITLVLSAYRQRYAEGYQAGVIDATQGRLWCAPPGTKPSEVDDRIWSELRQRAGTMPGSAAAELVRLYAAHFPCPAGS
jgi:hypothetical protein